MSQPIAVTTSYKNALRTSGDFSIKNILMCATEGENRFFNSNQRIPTKTRQVPRKNPPLLNLIQRNASKQTNMSHSSRSPDRTPQARSNESHVGRRPTTEASFKLRKLKVNQTLKKHSNLLAKANQRNDELREQIRSESLHNQSVKMKLQNVINET